MRALTLFTVSLLMLTASCGDDASDTTTTAEERETTTTEEDDTDTPEDEASQDDVPGDALPTAECDEAMAEAAAVGDMEDTVEDLWPAARACESLADWTAASEAHPDALDGAPPEMVATNVCLYGEDVAGSPLCTEVAG